MVESIDEAVAAVRELGRLDRGLIRERIVRRFSVQRLVHDYLAIYRSLIGPCELSAKVA